MVLRPDPNAYPPRGMSREQAAHYVGVSPSTFDTMVAEHEMPRPKRWRGRVLWDRLSLDLAFDALPETPTEVQRILEQSRRAS
jgi:predicted DNA-binding transcriptional regulator AlpA